MAIYVTSDPNAPFGVFVAPPIIGYIESRNQIESLVKKYNCFNLAAADMPMLIHAATDDNILNIIRNLLFDTVTGEYHGMRDGHRSYEVWHSAGSLATAKGLEKAISDVDEYSFTPVPNEEWDAMGEGRYNRKKVKRVHLGDLRAGNVPKFGTPYTISLDLPDDYKLIPRNAPMNEVLERYNRGGLIIFERGKLNADQFRIDDRVLSILGSPENREMFYKIMLKSHQQFFAPAGIPEEELVQFFSINSFHRIKEIGFYQQARGRLIYVYFVDDSIDGDRLVEPGGSFVHIS